MHKESKPTLRAVGYCRTSGEGQRDNTSIPNQKRVIEEFCERNGWEFLKHYVDESKTGSKVEGRESFQAMLKHAALEQFDLIVPFDVSRFARDGVDVLGNAKLLRDAFGVHVVDTKGHFDSRPGGNTLLNFVHAGVSEYERLKIMERMIGGRIARAKEGKPWSGKKPFGRDYDKASGKWYVNERGKRMRELLTRYVEGERLNDLLKEFTEFSSPHVVLFSVRNSQLSGTYVKEFNIPELDIKGQEIPIPAIPEVISPELEQRVRDRMDHNRSWNRDSLRQYLLTSFIRCKDCGHALSGNWADGVKYYRHHRYAKGQHECPFHSIREDVVAGPVLDYLFNFFTDEPAFNAAVADAIPGEDEREEMERARERIKRKVVKKEQEISNLANAIAKGADPSLLIGKQTEIKREQEREGARLKEIEEKLEALPDREALEHEAMAIRLHLLEQVRERDWRKLGVEEVRKFLVFLFGENPGKNGDGIFVTQDEKGRWQISFKGTVAFEHEIVDGKPVSEAMRNVAERHNKRVKGVLKRVKDSVTSVSKSR